MAFDQLTKSLVRSLLDRGESWPGADWPVRLYYVTNAGAAFGALENQTIFLVVMAMIGLVAILLYYRYPPFDHLVAPIAIGMLLGGAVGNLVDRVRLGEVGDFIKLPLSPAFNLADLSIGIAVVIILVGYAFLTPLDGDQAPSDDSGEKR